MLFQAIEDGMRMKFGNGKAKLCTSVLDLDMMGVAIGLYFRLMRYLTLLFLLMSILAIPALWICRAGSRVSNEDVDPLKLNIWSLGNVNTGNTTLGPKTYSAEQAAFIISMSDLAYSILFLGFIFFWKFKTRAVSEAVNDDVLQLSDYSVRCRCSDTCCLSMRVLTVFALLLTLCCAGHGETSASHRHRPGSVRSLQQPVRSLQGRLDL